MRRWILLGLLASASPAAAEDAYFTQQGRVLDSVGTPIGGTHSVTVSIHDAVTDGDTVWSKTTSNVAFVNGYYAVEVTGQDDTLRELNQAPANQTNGLYLSVAIDNAPPLEPRTRLASYTFAGVTIANDGLTIEKAVLSCQDLQTALPATQSGNYWIDPDGEEGSIAPFWGYCDMRFDGGWTLVLRGGTGVPTQASWYTSNAYNVDSGAASGGQFDPTFKLADTVINAFSGVYRTETAGSYIHTRYSPSGCQYAHTSVASGDCATTCSDLALSTCSEPGTTIYGRGLSGGVGSEGNGCGVQYFATNANSSYMDGPSAQYNMYWIVQTVGNAANNSSCAIGPGQRWADNASANADSTITVWRR